MVSDVLNLNTAKGRKVAWPRDASYSVAQAEELRYRTPYSSKWHWYVSPMLIMNGRWLSNASQISTVSCGCCWCSTWSPHYCCDQLKHIPILFVDIESTLSLILGHISRRSYHRPEMLTCFVCGRAMGNRTTFHGFKSYLDLILSYFEHFILHEALRAACSSVVHPKLVGRISTEVYHTRTILSGSKRNLPSTCQSSHQYPLQSLPDF